MSARMVRTGGIAAIAIILIVPVSGYLFASVAFSAQQFNFEVVLGNAILTLVLMYVVFLACAVFVFRATKHLFNASGYRAADTSIVTLLVLLALVPPVAPLAWAWFSIFAIAFGRRVHSRLWQAIGIIYLVASVLIVGVMVVGFGGIDVPNFGYFNYANFIKYSGLVLLVGLFCHGISLIAGARMMDQT